MNSQGMGYVIGALRMQDSLGHIGDPRARGIGVSSGQMQPPWHQASSSSFNPASALIYACRFSSCSDSFGDSCRSGLARICISFKPIQTKHQQPRMVGPPPHCHVLAVHLDPFLLPLQQPLHPQILNPAIAINQRVIQGGGEIQAVQLPPAAFTAAVKRPEAARLSRNRCCRTGVQPAWGALSSS